jgi:hypothetical protein
LQLAGVLRLSKALDMRNEYEPRLEVQLQDNIVLVRVAGYSTVESSAERVAAARHLLETVLRRPVLVRALRVVPNSHSRRFTKLSAGPRKAKKLEATLTLL